MSIFNAPADFSDFKAYIALLKKAMVLVVPGAKPHFAFYKEYPYADKKRPCVLVDYGPKCLDDVKAATKLAPTALGKVSLTADNKLQFMPEHGECKSEVVRKFFETLGSGVKEVYVEGDAPTPNRPINAPQLKSPVLPPGFRMPPAPQSPGAGQPQPAATPHPGQANLAAAPQAAPARPLRPGAAAPTAKVQHNTFDTFLMPNKEADRKPAIKRWIDALTNAKLPITDDHKRIVLAQATQYLDSGDVARALKVVNTLARAVTYPGVDQWALDTAQRNHEFGVVYEHSFAIEALIDKKRAPGSNDFAAEKQSAKNLRTMIGKCNEAIEAGLLTCDPEKVKAGFDAWVRLEQDRKKLTDRLKPLWMASQTKRMQDEAEKSKASRNIRLANSYGKEAMLEFATMAEVQALKFKEKYKNDPLAQEDWHLKLEVAELAAIYGYTTADFTPVGALLRAKKDTPEERAALKPQMAKYGEYILAAEAGLEKLPVYTGTDAVRCTKSLWKDTIDAIATTGHHVEKSFMSVGKQKVPGFGEIKWYFEKIKTGKDVTMFSLHQTEGEVLFPPNSRFKFLHGEIEDQDGKKIAISGPAELGKHATPETRVATLKFEQVS